MLRGLYAGASAMNAIARQQELISGNLANLQTNGHRRGVLSFEQSGNVGANSQTPQSPSTPLEAKESIDFSQGNVQTTGRALDVAVFGDGFLSVQGPDNQTLYTRAGSFLRSATGELQTTDGFAVLGAGGPITVDPGIADQDITISIDGIVSARGEELGRLQITTFADNSKLVPESQSYFKAPPDLATVESQASLMQGARELSNAHPVSELVGLIVNSRLYEAAQRTMRAISEATQQNYRG